jgi:hypothetical protein
MLRISMTNFVYLLQQKLKQTTNSKQATSINIPAALLAEPLLLTSNQNNRRLRVLFANPMTLMILSTITKIGVTSINRANHILRSILQTQSF